ncbi:MAG: methyltransferase domain-containing protein [Rhizobiales bacterium]|nr:methyltransferase domain-containing protein [Hyphomicrobiales bacterium]
MQQGNVGVVARQAHSTSRPAGRPPVGAERPEHVLAADYAGKSDAYFVGARRDFIMALERNPEARILEVGCGSGETAAIAFEMERCGSYIGIELDPAAAERARRFIPDVRVGNVETMAIDIPAASLDAVILSEVLEHLVDPWCVVARLAELLRPGGVMLASSPNVAHYGFVLQLLRGEWRLADSGPHDRTHLRWFTPVSYRAMFEEAGLSVRRLGPVAPPGPKARILSRLSAGRLDHLLMRQIAVEAVRGG